MQAEVDWQPSLFDGGSPVLDVSYTGIRRIVLDDRSWVDYCPSWLAGSDELFDLLAGEAQGESTGGPPILRDMASALTGRYGAGFDRIRVNLYRGGADSVAWHGDRSRLVMTRPLVATVSLGARRKFLLRPRGTSRALHRLEPGHGDLVVMGGECQAEWEHTVPKTKQPVGARMSVTIRHSAPAPGERWLREPGSREPGHAW